MGGKQGLVETPDRGSGFAEIAAYFRRQRIERSGQIVRPIDLLLVFRHRIAAQAATGTQTGQVSVSKPGERPLEEYLGGIAFANLARQRSRHGHIRRLAHGHQCRFDFTRRQHSHERGLSQVDSDGIVESRAQQWITGVVTEVRQHQLDRRPAAAVLPVQPRI